MTKPSQNTDSRCPAMIEAGIADPNSREGKLFCAGSRNGKIRSRCPYECCIVYESAERPAQQRAADKVAFVKDLKEMGITVDDIALILGVSLRKVQRYLKK